MTSPWHATMDNIMPCSGHYCGRVGRSIIYWVSTATTTAVQQHQHQETTQTSAGAVLWCWCCCCKWWWSLQYEYWWGPATQSIYYFSGQHFPIRRCQPQFSPAFFYEAFKHTLPQSIDLNKSFPELSRSRYLNRSGSKVMTDLLLRKIRRGSVGASALGWRYGHGTHGINLSAILWRCHCANAAAPARRSRGEIAILVILGRFWTDGRWYYHYYCKIPLQWLFRILIYGIGSISSQRGWCNSS